MDVKAFESYRNSRDLGVKKYGKTKEKTMKKYISQGSISTPF